MSRQFKGTPGPWSMRIVGSTLDTQRMVYCHIGPTDELKKGQGVAYAGTYGKTKRQKTSTIRLTDAECEANARAMSALPEMLMTLLAYEEWEAQLVLANEAWKPNGEAELPTIPRDLWDRLLEIQDLRNAALSKGLGEDA